MGWSRGFGRVLTGRHVSRTLEKSDGSEATGGARSVKRG